MLRVHGARILPSRARNSNHVEPGAAGATLAPGLGLSNRFIIDQHFRQRDRLGRLLTALAYNPFAVGIGLDEDTAAFIDAEDRLEVVGSGGITIVDPTDSTIVYSESQGGNMNRYDLTTGEKIPMRPIVGPRSKIRPQYGLT